MDGVVGKGVQNETAHMVSGFQFVKAGGVPHCIGWILVPEVDVGWWVCGFVVLMM